MWVQPDLGKFWMYNMNVYDFFLLKNIAYQNIVQEWTFYLNQTQWLMTLLLLLFIYEGMHHKINKWNNEVYLNMTQTGNYNIIKLEEMLIE